MPVEHHAYRVTVPPPDCTVLVIATSYGEAESVWVRERGCGVPDAAKRIVRIERLPEPVMEATDAS